MPEIPDAGERTPLLVARGICKSFPGVRALDGVDLEVYPGEVVALLGENGAGKSTLIKILSGAYRKDAGELRLRGQRYEPQNPVDALQAGIAVIHQELSLCLDMTVAENLSLGREPTRAQGWLPRLFRPVAKKHEDTSARDLLKRVHLDVSTGEQIRDLSVSVCQAVEIAKAVSLDADIIIMDEPTSSLTRQEVHTLFDIIAGLKARGKSIIFITHRLEEVFAVADRIAVMRDGRSVGGFPASEATIPKIVSYMVGREVDLFPKQPADLGSAVLEARHLTRGHKVRDVSFSVRRGEVVGFAGLVGAGRTEAMRLIFGADRKDAGEILIDGKPASINSPVDAIRAGIGMVPEDRKLQGLVLIQTITFNIALPQFGHLTRGPVSNTALEKQLAEEYVSALRVATPSITQQVQFLSGGNQQKVVLARWLAAHSRIIILDEPTRGVDVGAKSEIHSLINELARHGVGVILISSELPEILGMSDRIVVMAAGEVTGELSRAEASQEKIMSLAVPRGLGLAPEPAATARQASRQDRMETR